MKMNKGNYMKEMSNRTHVDVNIDILITNGTIITMDADRSIIEQGAVAVNNHNIIAIGKTQSLKNKFKPKNIIDAKNGIIMPGLVNTHTHAAMTLFRGFADDLILDKWLKDYIWPAEAKYINAKNVRLRTLLAIAEMIRSGTTTFSDAYFFEDETAKAAKDAGMRTVIGEGLLDFPTPNKKTPEQGLKYTEMLIKKWQDEPLINVAVAPHSPYTCSSSLLKDVKNISENHSVPIHTHLSETKKEVKDIQIKHNYTPVEYLNRLGILDCQVIAAHCVHLTNNDINIMAQKKVNVSHNPISNMKLASGVAPLLSLLKAGVNVGLGTDGAASNNNLNIIKEMNTAVKLHKLFTHEAANINAKTIVEMATISGAKVLGLNSITGSIETGKRADIIIINMNKPNAIPVYNLYSHLAYSVNSSDVETVIIDGKIIMHNRKILTFDEQKVMEDVRTLAAQSELPPANARGFLLL